jgi:hypothetical protein
VIEAKLRWSSARSWLQRGRLPREQSLRVVAGGVGLLLAACSAGASGPPLGGGTGGQAVLSQGGVNGGGAGGVVFVGATGGDPGVIVTGSGGADAGATTKPVGTGGAPQGPVSIDECLPVNPAGVDAATVQKLQAGSGSAGNLRLLNPYDGTVFPRGLIAPLLMWDGGGAADLVYLHIKASSFEYKGCLKPTAAGQLQVPQAIWDQAAAKTGGQSDPFTVELTTSSGGTATGPVSEKITIAQATLKGSIFYNSYSSLMVKPSVPSVGIFTGGSGAVLRIVPGKKAEAFLGQTQCTGCHSVSANGTRMVANDKSPTTSSGASYPITLGGAPNPTPIAPNAADGSFVGMYPDGSLYVSNAHPGQAMGPRAGFLGSQGAETAALHETDTGNVIAGSGVPTGTMTPMFSPDGSLLAFNDYAINGGHGLAVMTFDKASRTASAYKKVFEATDGTFPAWPFFLPDQKGLVFAVGTAADFSGMAIGLNLGGLTPVSSDLYVLDLASGATKLLARAAGFASDQDAQGGKTYLPFGPEELHHNFYPTVSPVAAGGYFWVFFDSFRHYGNTHTNTMVRQLWGAAVDISPTGAYTADPSHPAFYITGQEDVAGNHRAFTALDPCKKDGDTCTTGIDCCGGFCTDGSCRPPPPPAMGPQCAHTDESCASGMPCCNAKDRCIAGFCGQILQ